MAVVAATTRMAVSVAMVVNDDDGGNVGDDGGIKCSAGNDNCGSGGGKGRNGSDSHYGQMN